MLLLLVLFLFAALTAQSQNFEKEIYLNKKEREVKDPGKAAFKMSYIHQDEYYTIKFKRLSDNKVIQQKSYADEAMTILHGKQFYIDEKNPSNSYTEYYNENEPVGLWIARKDNKHISLDYDFELNYDSVKKKKEDVPPPVKEKTDTFEIVETMPEFPGGVNELMKFLSTNVFYAPSAKEMDIMGTVYCEFIIDEEGNATNIAVIKGVHPILDKEAVRILRLQPTWKPGTQRGKNVKVFFSIPIKFSLR